MLQLREGARPTGTTSGVSLSAIAERLRTSARQRGRVLEVRCAGAVETRGVEERIERVIGHAVQNAFDASRDEQPVRLQVDAVGSYARVRVVDEGVGMSPEFVRDRLFKPFQSTKEHGMGIGAFESRQTVHELGGKMEVVSEPGRGTTLTFLLPLFHSHSDSLSG
jgi:signal transduction histidine kinase